MKFISTTVLKSSKDPFRRMKNETMLIEMNAAK